MGSKFLAVVSIGGYIFFFFAAKTVDDPFAILEISLYFATLADT
jgi:hypothetical protein